MIRLILYGPSALPSHMPEMRLECELFCLSRVFEDIRKKLLWVARKDFQASSRLSRHSSDFALGRLFISHFGIHSTPAETKTINQRILIVELAAAKDGKPVTFNTEEAYVLQLLIASFLHLRLTVEGGP